MQGFKEIGKRFKLIKEHFSLSNQEFGEICGVSYTAIGNIINGTTKDPSVSLFVKISSKLEINLNWMITGKGEMIEKEEDKPLSTENLETIKYLKQEIENLKLIIESKQNEIETFKKIVALLEEKKANSKSKAS
jgi:transcriptional regulator with XRE-family HTH domain